MKEEYLKFFTEENYLPEEDKEIISPSGRYHLLIQSYKTKEGSWNYSRCLVYRISDRTKIADIKRNYSFEYDWIQKNGQEYLITGRSYMNQVIINCDTEEEFNQNPRYKTDFCWSQCWLTPDEKTLVVSGCLWGDPYEYKFFDFSDLSKGWKELEIYEKREYLKNPPKYSYPVYVPNSDYFDGTPEFFEDGSIVIYDTSDIFIPLNKRDSEINLEILDSMTPDMSNLFEENSNWKVEKDSRFTFRREKDFIIQTEIWHSEWKLDQMKSLSS